METIKSGNVLYMPRRVTGRMNALERIRAYEGMRQAMALADLTLAAVARTRAALRRIGSGMFKAHAGRSGAVQAEMRGR